jgi:hypothetical protein
MTRLGLNEAATAARRSRFCEGFLPERMWMLKPIPQTGVADGPGEPSSPPHDRGHDGPQHGHRQLNELEVREPLNAGHVDFP